MSRISSTSSRAFCVTVAAGMLVSTIVTTAFAQEPARQRAAAPARPGPGIVVGVVVDTLGRAVIGATVFIQNRQRETTTAADGTFRFEGVRTDTITVATRIIGFYPQSKRVRLTSDGGSVLFEIEPRVTSLPAAITEATITGLSGVVSDTASNALAGAEVQVAGAGRVLKTDSSGSFFIDVRPGQYVVRVARKGHVAQMIGVTIPPKGGRRIAVRLTPGTDPYHARNAWAADGINSRLVRRSPVWSRVFTREEISAMNSLSLVAMARLGAVGRVDEDCVASVDGRGGVPLWALDPDDIEFFEVYARMPNTGLGTISPRGVTSIGGSRPITTQQRTVRRPNALPSGPCPAGLFVWTRK